MQDQVSRLSVSSAPAATIEPQVGPATPTFRPTTLSSRSAPANGKPLLTQPPNGTLSAHEAHAQRRTITLADIQFDGWVRARKTVDQAKIEAIRETISEGMKLEPPVVFEAPDKQLWLGDGADRISAYMSLNYTELECIVMPGTRRDAYLHSLKTNGRHGTPLSSDDRRANARQMLIDTEWSGSARMIAELCGLSDKTVGAMRDAMIATAEVPQSVTVTSKDGRKRPAKRRPLGGPGAGNRRDQKTYKVDKASGYMKWEPRSLPDAHSLCERLGFTPVTKPLTLPGYDGDAYECSPEGLYAIVTYDRGRPAIVFVQKVRGLTDAGGDSISASGADATNCDIDSAGDASETHVVPDADPTDSDETQVKGSNNEPEAPGNAPPMPFGVLAEHVVHCRSGGKIEAR